MAGYGEDGGFTAWLSANGHALPDGAPAIAVLRQRGSAYIDATYGSRFLGTPTSGFEQERAWPRTGAHVHGTTMPDNVVPQTVINASYEAAYQEAVSPGILTAIGSTAARVKREKVEGAVEVEYQSTFGSKTLLEDMTVIITSIEGMLTPYLGRSNLPGVLVV